MKNPGVWGGLILAMLIAMAGASENPAYCRIIHFVAWMALGGLVEITADAYREGR